MKFPLSNFSALPASGGRWISFVALRASLPKMK